MVDPARFLLDAEAAIVAQGVGFFRTEAHVRAAIRSGLADVMAAQVVAAPPVAILPPPDPVMVHPPVVVVEAVPPPPPPLTGDVTSDLRNQLAAQAGVTGVPDATTLLSNWLYRSGR